MAVPLISLQDVLFYCVLYWRFPLDRCNSYGVHLLGRILAAPLASLQTKLRCSLTVSATYIGGSPGIAVTRTHSIHTCTCVCVHICRERAGVWDLSVSLLSNMEKNEKA